jgi:tetratricopeptide (TPR) repeat protein
VADYTVLVTRNPNDVESLVRRGFTYASMQDYEKAIPDYEAALKLKPDDYETVQRLQYARSMLAAKNAPPPAATPVPTPTPEGLFTPINIGVGLAAILIIAVIIKLVTRGKPEENSSSTRIR